MIKAQAKKRYILNLKDKRAEARIKWWRQKQKELAQQLLTNFSKLHSLD